MDALFTRLGFLGFGARRGMTDGARRRVLWPLAATFSFRSLLRDTVVHTSTAHIRFCKLERCVD